MFSLSDKKFLFLPLNIIGDLLHAIVKDIAKDEPLEEGKMRVHIDKTWRDILGTNLDKFIKGNPL